MQAYRDDTVKGKACFRQVCCAYSEEKKAQAKRLYAANAERRKHQVLPGTVGIPKLYFATCKNTITAVEV